VRQARIESLHQTRHETSPLSGSAPTARTAYVDKPVSQGKSKKEAIRCLKRYIVHGLRRTPTTNCLLIVGASVLLDPGPLLTLTRTSRGGAEQNVQSVTEPAAARPARPPVATRPAGCGGRALTPRAGSWDKTLRRLAAGCGVVQPAERSRADEAPGWPMSGRGAQTSSARGSPRCRSRPGPATGSGFGGVRLLLRLSAVHQLVGAAQQLVAELVGSGRDQADRRPDVHKLALD
jgi:hypothetical protein